MRHGRRPRELYSDAKTAKEIDEDFEDECNHYELIERMRRESLMRDRNAERDRQLREHNESSNGEKST